MEGFEHTMSINLCIYLYDDRECNIEVLELQVITSIIGKALANQRKNEYTIKMFYYSSKGEWKYAINNSKRIIQNTRTIYR